MPRFSSTLALLAAAARVTQAANFGSGACSGDSCAATVAEEAEEQVLLAVGNTKARAARRLDTQRSDDLMPVSPPEAVSPEAYVESKPLPPLLPAPNPADSPFINGYMEQNCTEETWPFFVNVGGRWEGNQGQNFIALPQADARPAGKDFLVQVNRYSETVDFGRTGPVLNRGYLNGVQVQPAPGCKPGLEQSDQIFTGVTYAQVVTDLDLNMIIHKENGFFLHQACAPINGHLMDDWQVMRAGAIPHGSQPMGFGNMKVVNTPAPDYYVQMLVRLRDTYVHSVQPFVPGCGPQMEQQRKQAEGTPQTNNGPLGKANFTGPSCCIGGGGYMKGTDQCPQTGCPEPIDILIDAVKDLNVIKYVEMEFSTEDTVGPNIPLGGFSPGIHGGGVQNTAYVNRVAEAPSKSFKNHVWYLTVKQSDGSTYDLIQYIETVDLKFLAKAPGCPDQLWPHVDANTLKRSPDSPEEPSPTMPE